MIEIFFKDDGKGMSEQELDALFSDLEQILDDDEDEAKGIYEDPENPVTISLGLGLAMTARFVHLNCGQIAIASEPGRGTKVSVKIPFNKAKAEPNRETETPSQNELPTPPLLSPDISSVTGGTSGVTAPRGPERAQSLDTTLPIRNPYAVQFAPNTESVASVAQAVSLATAPTFDPNTGRYPFPTVTPNYKRVNVLIAEDNPLNSRLLETRLTRRGHDVRLTVDGGSCADVFKATPDAFDVILMDLQVRPLYPFLLI